MSISSDLSLIGEWAIRLSRLVNDSPSAYVTVSDWKQIELFRSRETDLSAHRLEQTVRFGRSEFQDGHDFDRKILSLFSEFLLLNVVKLHHRFSSERRSPDEG